MFDANAISTLQLADKKVTLPIRLTFDDIAPASEELAHLPLSNQACFAHSLPISLLSGEAQGSTRAGSNAGQCALHHCRRGMLRRSRKRLRSSDVPGSTAMAAAGHLSHIKSCATSLQSASWLWWLA